MKMRKGGQGRAKEETPEADLRLRGRSNYLGTHIPGSRKASRKAVRAAFDRQGGARGPCERDKVTPAQSCW